MSNGTIEQPASVAEGATRWSFRRGWLQLRQQDVPEARQKLMTALGFTAERTWYKRLEGEVEPTVTQFETIERVFAEYGITDVWGTEPATAA